MRIGIFYKKDEKEKTIPFLCKKYGVTSGRGEGKRKKMRDLGLRCQIMHQK